MKTSQNKLTIFDFATPVMFNSLFSRCPDGLLFFDRKGNIIFCNEKAEDIFNIPMNEMIGKSFDFIFPAVSTDQVNVAKLVKSKNLLTGSEMVELQGLNKVGTTTSIEMSLKAAQDGTKYLLVAIIRDISERVILQQKLYEQAITDSLTGLNNRRHFDNTLTTEFNRSRRYKRPLSVIIVDIDRFKQANDSHGHAFGDEMLIKAKIVFLEAIRNIDTAFRYGGDEFAIILPETPKEEALDIAERLRKKFIEKCKLEKKRVNLSLSIGLACFPEDGKDEKSLIGAADRRMYRSKGEGGNHITAYTSTELLDHRESVLIRTLTDLTLLTENNLSFRSLGGISHSQRARALSVEIGRKYGLSADRITLLEHASMLHDIGILYVSKHILHKVSSLTDDEFKEIKKHPLIGEEILTMALSSSNKIELADIPRIVGQHHEFLDGTGYPRGLKGDDILIESRILTLVDSYEAMTSDRPHRKALGKKKTADEVNRFSGNKFDSRIVDILFDIENLEGKRSVPAQAGATTNP